MPRAVPEWIGKTDNAKVPPRVRLRIFLRDEGRCWISGRKIAPGERWELEHKIALCNGGRHAESNLAPALVGPHKEKTKADVAEKALVYRKRKSNLGIKKTKGRPMPGSKASGWKRTFNNGWVRR